MRMTETFCTRTYPAGPRGALGRALKRFAPAALAALCAASGAAAQEKSGGVYRVPFENGTTVERRVDEVLAHAAELLDAEGQD